MILCVLHIEQGWVHIEKQSHPVMMLNWHMELRIAWVHIDGDCGIYFPGEREGLSLKPGCG